MNSFWHDCIKFARSTWAVDLPRPADLSPESAYNWCRIPIKTYKQTHDFVISVPMPIDLDVESIRIVTAPRTVGLRLCKGGGGVWLSRSISVSFDLVEPITWQVDDGLLFIRLPLQSAECVTRDQGSVGEDAHLTFEKIDGAAAKKARTNFRTQPKRNWLEPLNSATYQSRGTVR